MAGSIWTAGSVTAGAMGFLLRPILRASMTPAIAGAAAITRPLNRMGIKHPPKNLPASPTTRDVRLGGKRNFAAGGVIPTLARRSEHILTIREAGNRLFRPWEV